MTTKIKKGFDCVDFKRGAQLAIYDEIRGMTHEQEQAYFSQQAEKGPLTDWWRRIKAAERLGTNRDAPA